MRNLIKSLAVVAALVLGATAASATDASDTSAVKLGVITCDVDGGWGVLIGSKKDVACTFTGKNGRTTEYIGSIGRLGVDVGYTGTRKLVWAVFSVGNGSSADLAGTYIGAGASVNALVGVGANALVGGMQNSIVLNPVSIEGSTGVSVAAGVTSLTLE